MLCHYYVVPCRELSRHVRHEWAVYRRTFGEVHQGSKCPTHIGDTPVTHRRCSQHACDSIGDVHSMWCDVRCDVMFGDSLPIHRRCSRTAQWSIGGATAMLRWSLKISFLIDHRWSHGHYFNLLKVKAWTIVCDCNQVLSILWPDPKVKIIIYNRMSKVSFISLKWSPSCSSSMTLSNAQRWSWYNYLKLFIFIPIYWNNSNA